MATYKSSAGAILQPGNQINKLSGYNDEGVFGWPGVEAFELIGFSKITNKSGTKANFKSLDITVPSPDRRPDDRVRDDRTSLVVQASADRPAYIYGASIGIAQDLPAGGLATFPASPVTADLGGTTGELLLLGPNNVDHLSVYLPHNKMVWQQLLALLQQLVHYSLKEQVIQQQVTFLSGQL